MKKIIFLLFILLPFLSKSQVNITGYVAPFGLGQYPTHADSLGYGGYRVARDTFERNQITSQRRKKGMAVYVQDKNKIYILNDSTGLNNWTEFTTSSISKAVDSIYRKVSKDSIFYRANNIEYSIRDKKVDSVYKNATNDSFLYRVTDSTIIKLYDRIGITDTSSLSNRINQKLNIVDTSNKWVNNIGKNTTNDSIIFFIGNNRYAIKDSSSSNIGTGTVKKITQGYGIISNPNPIIDSGTITIDSATLSNKYVRINDTSKMLSKYLQIFDTTKMLSYYVPKTRKILTTSPLQGGGNLNGDLTLSMDSANDFRDGYLTQYRFTTFNQKVSSTRSISTTSPLSGGGDLSANRTISIPKATTSVDGYLSATDYLTFAGKQGALSPISPIEINGSLLSIRKASSTDSGYLSASNWNTFNNKLNASDTTSLSNRINLKLNTSDTTNKFVNNVVKLNDSTISIYKGTGYTNITLNSSKIDSLKRSNDSIFARKNGTFVFQYKDTLGDDTATVVIAQVYNAEANTLNRGEVVYLYGANGNRASVKRAINTNDSTSSKTFGFVRENILSGGIGYIVTQGQIGKLNLNSYSVGQTIYLDSIAGQFTSVKPSAPKHLVTLGVIERANTGNGLIYVKPQNGFELSEIHDVQLNGILNNSLLYYDSTNKLWKANKLSFTKNTAKDSIILNYGSLRLAVKDSVGGGGGTPGGYNSLVQFNNNGSFDGDPAFNWDNTNKRLGIGIDEPQTTLDVRQGTGNFIPSIYEVAMFSKDGDTKIGIYNSGDYGTGGASIMLGHTKNPNASQYYPGFEFQNGNDSASSSGFVRYNYVEKDVTGAIGLASTDLFNINSSGLVQINPTNYGLSASPRLVVGDDNYGAMLETSGSAYIENKFITNGARVKKVTYLNDGDIGDSYSVTADDHIIIYVTNYNECTIYLPASPDNGRELVIKHLGDYNTYGLILNGNGHEISGDSYAYIDNTQNSASVTIVYYDGIWYVINGVVYQ